uniref:Pre-mRNA-splicing factor SYF2 n=1 Tax=Strigamia maritima TaxID=126957 RepID=T1IY12_STRMM
MNVPEDAKTKRDRLKKLRDLQLKRNEARKLNHQEVVEEDRKKKLPTNWVTKQKYVEWEMDDEKKRKEAQDQGESYDLVKLLDISANTADRLENKKRKKNPDPGFADYEQATARQYDRLVKQIKPDMDEYNMKKEKMGEAFYAGKDTILQGINKDSKEGIDRMVEDLEKQIDKRSKYSRRRMHNDDADIDYINERNMKFNKKLERFYGQYTGEIKQNLERGTARLQIISLEFPGVERGGFSSFFYLSTNREEDE